MRSLYRQKTVLLAYVVIGLFVSLFIGNTLLLMDWTVRSLRLSVTMKLLITFAKRVIFSSLFVCLFVC